MKQSDKLTAYYFRAAQQIDTLYLDNQMQKLLYHASQNGITTFALYVDNGYSGLNSSLYQVLSAFLETF